MTVVIRHGRLTGAAAFAWPDATNTGPTGTLTTVSHDGQITINTDGTIVENIDIGGPTFYGYWVPANNVIFRNCIIRSLGYYGIDVGGANCTVQDCRIIGGGASSAGNDAINGARTVERCELYWFENGMRIGSDCIIRRNYVHDLLSSAGEAGHYDGIACHGGNNTLIEENTIMARDTSCVFLKNDWSDVFDVTVNHNYMGGVAGWPMNVSTSGSSGYHIYDCTITNNHIEMGVFGGYISMELYPEDYASMVVEGNVDAFTGAPVGF